MGLRAGFVVVVAVAVLLALVPVWVPVLDSVVAPGTVAEVPVGVGEGVQVLIPSAVSCQGSDRLEVYPGAVLAEPGSVVNVTIKVFFKHAQPCPYSDWSVSYEVSGDVEVVGDDGGRLADVKTYVRVLSVRVDGNGTLTVVYDYGTCPEGDKEVVTVDFYVGSAPGGLTPVTTTPASTGATAEGEEGEVYVNVTGSVVSVDPYGGTLIIDDKVIYFRGEFYNPSTGAYLEKEQVLASLSPGDYVTVVCKVTGAGRYMAEEVVLPNGTVLTKG